jgi:triphosphoribosyl-dephospho-CoA synthase
MLEVVAPKPGNVHRGADFHDCGLVDFLASAIAIGPVLELASERPLGKTVLDCVTATAHVCRRNTNLGIVLLLSPLAAVRRDQPLEEGVQRVLADLSAEDARHVYQAIRMVQPGGLQPLEDSIEELNIRETAPADLLLAMRAAADRDLIALQYTNGFEQVFHNVLPWLVHDPSQSLTQRIVWSHIKLMSSFPDSLIRRKAGLEIAQEAAARAARVLDSGPFESDTFQQALADLDFWLRSDGNRRNPGTTADLIAAGLFVGLREGRIGSPYQ